MSHRAKDWLARIDVRDLKGSEFKVLFFLCEHHNADKKNAVACYPSQSLLMEKTGLSNGSLNNALNGLERAGHIKRIRGTKPGSSTRRTYYLLRLEPETPSDHLADKQHAANSTSLEVGTTQAPSIGDGTNSTQLETARKQTPKKRQANSKNGSSKLHSAGDEPVREPVREPCVSSEPSHTQDFVFEDFVGQFETIYPRLGDGPATLQALRKAIEEGSDPAAILAGARTYAAEQKGNDRQFIKFSENWLRDKRWMRHTPTTTKPVSRNRILEAHAKTIKQGKPFLCTAITDQTAWECVQAELVSIQDCRAVGKLL